MFLSVESQHVLVLGKSTCSCPWKVNMFLSLESQDVVTLHLRATEASELLEFAWRNTYAYYFSMAVKHSQQQLQSTFFSILFATTCTGLEQLDSAF